MKILILLAGLLAPNIEAKEPPPEMEKPPLVCGFMCYYDGKCLLPPISCAQIPYPEETPSKKGSEGPRKP